jgi:hypothetical protein
VSKDFQTDLPLQLEQISIFLFDDSESCSKKAQLTKDKRFNSIIGLCDRGGYLCSL